MRAALLKMMSAQKTWIETSNAELILQKLPVSQDDLPPRSMMDSNLEAFIPLQTYNRDRLKYVWQVVESAPLLFRIQSI